jgi:phenylacetate-CoA ligase
MNIQSKIKSIAEKIPPGAGVYFNHVPFNVRLGNDYSKFGRLIDDLIKADQEIKRKYVIGNFNNIFTHFNGRDTFYNNFLQQNGCDLNKIRSLEEIAAVPLLTKSILRDVPVSERTIREHALKQFNTGGTSGFPLTFFAEKKFYPREWAHMHYMWKKIGYSPAKTKITIRGKNMDRIYQYNFNQNEFLINSYHPFNKNDYLTLLKVFKRYNTEFLHGYPSSVFNLIKEISVNAPFLLDFLRANIKGIMFASEYPSPRFRDYIEEMLTPNTISWYGHTEGVVLAGELLNKFEYIPFLSYGYAEAVKKGEHYHLAGTSFHNLAAPFIRYDTEDLIKPVFAENGMLSSFEITEGRLGEFVIDKNGRNISLTALIFGRHHKLFERVNFIQVKQTIPGKVIIYYSNASAIDEPAMLFDSDNLDIDLQFQQITEPIKTSLGKIPLLIK